MLCIIALILIILILFSLQKLFWKENKFYEENEHFPPGSVNQHGVRSDVNITKYSQD